MNNPPHCRLSTGYKEKYPKEMLNPKLHGLQTHDHLVGRTISIT